MASDVLIIVVNCFTKFYFVSFFPLAMPCKWVWSCRRWRVCIKSSLL